ncbi:NEL-type E3 ubiquitin ligase domain-containing protein [Bordetella flabilis]|nr:NEL-type E3 ubiquitin ligase domain-containing protein [Bordetella flabilis]
MSTTVASAGGHAFTPMLEQGDRPADGEAAPDAENIVNSAARQFTDVRPASAPQSLAAASGALTLSEALQLLVLLPRSAQDVPLPRPKAMPEDIARDMRRRMIFRVGEQAALELGLDLEGHDADAVMALGRQTIIDHALSGDPYGVLVSMARLEGKLDEAAWAAGDEGKIAEEAAAFARSVFEAEIELYEALGELAAAPPLPVRSELAHEILRQHGIDPDAKLAGSDGKYAYPGVAMFTPALVLDWKAGEHYFNRDRLTADDLRKMKLLDGGTPSEAHIAGILAQLPDSLDQEFGRRFDAHKQAMSASLARWLAARLSMHAGDAGIDLANARVTISRARMRFYKHRIGAAVGGVMRARVPYRDLPAHGFVVTIGAADTERRCFVSSRTGAVHALSTDGAIEEVLKRDRDAVFEDAETRARLRTGGEPWTSRVVMEEMGSGQYGALRDWLPVALEAEIEAGREAARGLTPREGMIDTLLNLIPFRAMVVALQRGDIGMAVFAGGLDVLSLLPLVGAGFRFSTAVARAGAPLAAFGGRLGGIAARQALNGLRALPGRVPALRDGIRASLGGTVARAWGRARPVDIQRIATAVRATSPGLADMLDRIVATASRATVADGVWRVPGAGAAASRTGTAIGPIRMTKARNLEGGELALLPYGNGAATFTRVDTVTGNRLGALLAADSAGWLYRSMPVETLERFRVRSPDILQAMAGRRPGPDGTIALDAAHYVHLGGEYIQLEKDRAASTTGRPIWRVVAQEGSQPDLIPQRLRYDADKKLWLQAEAPALSGQSRFSLFNRTKPAGAAAGEGGVTPSVAQMARFRNALVGAIRNAAPGKVEILQALLDRLATHRRGGAILRALAAHHELLGQVPQIELRDASNAAQARPSLGRPVRGTTWHLDLEALRFGTTDDAATELAAVYNNMTGLLQNEEPFETLLAAGEPALDASLEQAWSAWTSRQPDAGTQAQGQAARYTPVVTLRDLAVSYLRTQLREMRCYGGLDKWTLKSLLWNEAGSWHSRINLSRRGLDSVPPLPADITSLALSHNPITDWRNLPPGLKVLHAEGTEMTALPANLPKGLIELNVANNSLGRAALVFPSGLQRLEIGRNGLTALPALPRALEHLLIYRNNVRVLPENLPPKLREIDASNNELTHIPVRLPASLQFLRLAQNRLSRLPGTLPAGLVELDVSANQLASLPVLPESLQELLVGLNMLEELPARLPRRLETLEAPRNRLRRLPDDLPRGLTLLDAQRNLITTLPRNIMTLRMCVIHLNGNPIPAENIAPATQPGIGPYIYIAGSDADPEPGSSGLAHAARYWLRGRPEAEMGRWDAIEHELAGSGKGAALTAFLGRLAHTLSYKDMAFRTQVADWLVELSKPERKALLADTLTICRGATESCEDRVVLTWNALQTLCRNDDIRQGLYDDRIDEALDLARQMFRLNVLTEIARQKEATLAYADQVEVYLAYVVRLRNELGLTTVAPAMRFYEISGVKPHDVVQARQTVLAREREEFDQFLVLDYEPWQTLLKRKDPERYAAAHEKMHQLLDSEFERRMQEELAKLALDATAVRVLEDARKDLGPVIQREIQYSVLAPLSRALLEPPPAAGAPA